MIAITIPRSFTIVKLFFDIFERTQCDAGLPMVLQEYIAGESGYITDIATAK